MQIHTTMFDLKQNLLKLLGFTTAAFMVWWLIVYGIGEPFGSSEFQGWTPDQVRNRCGDPIQTWVDVDGNQVWNYKNGLLPMGASSDIVFADGVVVAIRGHTPNK
jgi:hypothetical protein